MSRFHIVLYHHRHGTDAWPYTGPPHIKDVIAEINRENPEDPFLGEEEGEWVELVGPFDNPVIIPPKDPDVCSVCGSESVQVAVWAEANTQVVHDDFHSWNYEGSTWCPNCEEHHPLVPKSEYDGTVECTDCDKRIPFGEEHRPHDFCPVCDDCFEAHYDKDDPETVAADIARDRAKDDECEED